MPRPVKYTPARVNAILEGLRVGMTRTAAASRGEVDRHTLTVWMKRYPPFSADVLRAEAEAEARFTSTLAQAAAPHDVVETTLITKPDGSTERRTITRREFDWRAAESWLKRRRREEWGDNVAVDLDREIAELLAQVAGTGEAETEG
jgi:hypothetical protein